MADPLRAFTFAIVGGGLTATSMLCQLVDRLTGMGERGVRSARALTLELFEKHPVAGPGMPHNEAVVLPLHITNMCAEDMTVRAENPLDFQQWVAANPDRLRRYRDGGEPDQADPFSRFPHCHHYPRAVMGAYLRDRLTTSVAAGRRLGLTIAVHEGCEVVDLEERDGEFFLAAEPAGGHAPFTCRADGVLLATGHWLEPTGHAACFPSPWPAASLLREIPTGARVGVRGSSLSAIEVALTLSSNGRFSRTRTGRLRYVPGADPRTITFYSRRGLLPRVRGRLGTRPNRFLTCARLEQLIAARPGHVSLDSVFALLDRELSDAYGAPIDWERVIEPRRPAIVELAGSIEAARSGDGPAGESVWQTVLTQIFPLVRELYLNLDPADRDRFEHRFGTVFFMHAATQPLINAERLLALMEAGIVGVVRLGADYRFARDEKSDGFAFTYRGSDGRPRRDSFRYVVNARGQSRAVASDRSRLTRNLLARNLVTLAGDSGNGTIVVRPDTHQALRPGTDERGIADRLLFAVGAMTRGQMIDASMAYGLARSTATVAEALIERIRMPGDSVKPV